MSETSTMNTDRLYMDIQGHRLYVELYGWLIHHFLKIKDNYFGDDLHFKTLEEFQGRQSMSLAVDGTEPHGEPSKISNDLDVILSIGVEETGSKLRGTEFHLAWRRNFVPAAERSRKRRDASPCSWKLNLFNVWECMGRVSRGTVLVIQRFLGIN